MAAPSSTRAPRSASSTETIARSTSPSAIIAILIVAVVLSMLPGGAFGGLLLAVVATALSAVRTSTLDRTCLLVASGLALVTTGLLASLQVLSWLG